jgi:hypothetical protein
MCFENPKRGTDSAEPRLKRVFVRKVCLQTTGKPIDLVKSVQSTLALDVQCQEWPESGHAPYTGRNTGTVSSIDKF